MVTKIEQGGRGEIMYLKKNAGDLDFYIKKDTYKAPMASMHYHIAFELYYVINGEREYFIEDRFLKVGDGDFLLIPPNTMHRTAGKGATRVLIHFTENFLLRYFTYEALDALMIKEKPFVFHPTKEDQAFFEKLISHLLEEGDIFAKGKEKNAAFFLFEMLFRMSYVKNDYVEQRYSDQRISRIVQYINENYSKIATIDQIADTFYLSKFYLCRLFAKELGVSLISYLNMIKIRAACAMIEANKFTMTEIALRCGFNSSSYFCKVFKNEMGISPKAYRAQFLGEE